MRRLSGIALLALSIGMLPVMANQSLASQALDTYIVVLQPGADRAATANEFSRAGWGIESEYTDVFSGFAITLPVAAVAALGRNSNVLFIERDTEITLFDSQLPGPSRGSSGGSPGSGRNDNRTVPKANFASTLPAAATAALARIPNVLPVDRDTEITASGTQSPAPSWGLDRIDQRRLPLSNSSDYSTIGSGEGVRAYIVDTGVLSSHTEFTGRMAAGYNTVRGKRTTEDCNGHGTHVAGTVAGTTYGVAKKATIVPVRVLNCQGSGTISGVIAGLDWVARDHISGPAVVNMSLGGSASAALDAAVAGVVNDGVTVAVAAGNSNADACLSSPSRVAQALTVGATTSTDARASYSNFGTCLDLFAPGSSITSAWNTSTTATRTISGTSMASPHVAGVAAVLLSRTPSMTPAEVASALTSSATTSVVTSAGTGSPNRLLYSDPLFG